MWWARLCFATQITAATAAPPLPYVDRGACPFECCTYRDWTAETRLDAYGHYEPAGRREVAFAVKPGERVTAMTGVVITTSAAQVRITKPTTLEVYSKRFPKSAPEKVALSRGDRVDLFTPQGEGWMSGWTRGRLLESFDAANFADARSCSRNPRCTGIIEKHAKREWWVKVRNARGQIGWILMGAGLNFSNTDACGAPSPEPRTPSPRQGSYR
jgi:hypothetical protein